MLSAAVAACWIRMAVSVSVLSSRCNNTIASRRRLVAVLPSTCRSLSQSTVSRSPTRIATTMSYARRTSWWPRSSRRSMRWKRTRNALRNFRSTSGERGIWGSWSWSSCMPHLVSPYYCLLAFACLSWLYFCQLAVWFSSGLSVLVLWGNMTHLKAEVCRVMSSLHEPEQWR